MTQTLSKTSPGGFAIKPHKHVIFVDTERGAMLCSINQKHTHQCVYTPAIPEQPAPLDPNTGEPTGPAIPGQPESYEIMPAEDGHTHEYTGEPIPIKPPKDKDANTDTDIIAEVRQYYLSAWEVESENFEDGYESDGFYTGKKQWTPDEKQCLKERDRACVTINDTAKEVDKLSGQQRQNRTDIKVVPMGGTDQKVCDALNYCLKNIQEQCFYQREEAKVFLDTIIVGRGLFNVYIDKTKNPEGDIIIEQMRWNDVVIGEHEKEDLSDAEHLSKSKMYSIGRLKAIYKDKVDHLMASFDKFQDMTPTVVSEDKSEDAYMQPNSETVLYTWGNGSIKLVDVDRKEMRVIEQYRKKYIEVPVIVGADYNFFADGFGFSTSDLTSIKTLPGFAIVERVVPKMVVTRVTADVVLERLAPAPLPVDDFFIVPVYCYKRGNRWWGKVEGIKDPQREVNKRHSQLIDIGNKAAGSGWLFDSQTFATEKEKENFKKNSSSPGFTAEVADMNNKPEQVTGGEVPPVLAQLLQMAHENLANLMSITAQPNGANESNAMFTYRQKLLSAGNEFISDNLRFAKIKLGRLLIGIIKDLYTPERIWDILKDENAKSDEGVSLGGEPLENFTEEDISRIFNDADLTKVDIIVTEGVYSPSIRMAIFVVLSDLMQAGVQIPPEMLFEFADVPQEVKDKIQKQMAEQAAQAGQEQQQKSTTELLKTMMGKGIPMTPEIQNKVNEVMGIETPPQMGGGALVQQ